MKTPSLKKRECDVAILVHILLFVLGIAMLEFFTMDSGHIVYPICYGIGACAGFVLISTSMISLCLWAMEVHYGILNPFLSMLETMVEMVVVLVLGTIAPGPDPEWVEE